MDYDKILADCNFRPHKCVRYLFYRCLTVFLGGAGGADRIPQCMQNNGYKTCAHPYKKMTQKCIAGTCSLWFSMLYCTEA